MTKIENSSDVLKWARMIVDAKGEKFTALSKAEQFVIARCIVDGAYEEDDGTHPPPPPPQAESRDASDPLKENERAVEPQGVSYKLIGCDAQQAFDKFLSWCKDHPKERAVMDFSTGEKSVAAAFAYWLCDHMKSLNGN